MDVGAFCILAWDAGMKHTKFDRYFLSIHIMN